MTYPSNHPTRSILRERPWMMLGQGLSLKLDLDGCFDGKVGGFPHFLLNHESIEASIYLSIQVNGLFSGSSKRLLNSGPAARTPSLELTVCGASYSPACIYSVVQKISCMFKFPAFLPPTNLGLPMHSPSALTEHVSLNLARWFLLNPVHRIILKVGG